MDKRKSSILTFSSGKLLNKKLPLFQRKLKTACYILVAVISICNCSMVSKAAEINVTPDVPDISEDMEVIVNLLVETNTYLAYQLAFNILVMAFAIFVIVYKFLHTTLFRRNDFLR